MASILQNGDTSGGISLSVMPPILDPVVKFIERSDQLLEFSAHLRFFSTASLRRSNSNGPASPSKPPITTEIRVEKVTVTANLTHVHLVEEPRGGKRRALVTLDARP